MTSTIRLHFVIEQHNAVETLEISNLIIVDKLKSAILEECGINDQANCEMMVERLNRVIDTSLSFENNNVKDGDTIHIQMGVLYIGRYKIDREIGEGGMGVVYEAYDPALDRQVAIKVINEDLAKDKQMMDRFAREARAVAKLAGQQHIVNVFDFVQGTNVKTPYFVMEYVDGLSLAELIEQRNSLALEQTAHILTGVAAALDAAHKQGIIHRDIKPGNILLIPDKELPGQWLPKLADFGLVRISEEISDLTQTGVVVGTPHYMSPEQIEAKPLSEQSDIYSLGVVVYEMLTGQRPFSDSTTTKLLIDHLKNEPLSPKHLRNDLPDAVATVVLKALAKKPDDRYTSAKEFAAEFAKAIKTKSTTNRNPKLSKRLIVLAGILTLLILSGAIIYLLSDGFTKKIQTASPVIEEQIIFDTDRDGNWNIHIMNTDGTEQASLMEPLVHNYSPDWSPDGTKIAFVTLTGENEDIYIMDSNGQNITRLTNQETAEAYPSWSPDGQKIVFDTNRDGNWEIYTMKKDGSSQSRLTTDMADDRFPAWSPDGSRIAYSSARDGNWEIYTMTIDGTDQKNLTLHPETDRYPAWSPDGELIAFASHRDGNWEIYVMNKYGTSQTRLTNNESNDFTPSWSPDGKYITFYSNRDGNDEIYIMNLDGTNQTRVTVNTFEDRSPAWKP